MGIIDAIDVHNELRHTLYIKQLKFNVFAHSVLIDDDDDDDDGIKVDTIEDKVTKAL